MRIRAGYMQYCRIAPCSKDTDLASYTPFFSLTTFEHGNDCLQADGQERYRNLGAVAVLTGPSWDSPSFLQYEAVHPRPVVDATYEVSTQALLPQTRSRP